VQWRRLDIVPASRGGPLEAEGTVEHKAYFRHEGRGGVQHESSRFVRRNRCWYYVKPVSFG